MQYITDLVAHQKAFFYTDETRSVKFRKRKLKVLKKAITENEELLFNALKQDFNKPVFESFISETSFLIKEIEHTLNQLDRWVQPERVSGSLLSFPSKSTIYKEPYGVALVISPWNYPVQLALAPAIAAIAAGNTVILKPSEHAPSTSEALASLVSKYFDSDFFSVVQGEVAETTALLKEPIDYVFFTGSPQVGKLVLKQAAEQLLPHTLELGGKSPAIVDASANIKLAAKRIAQGKFFNAGQTCIAPDYVLIDASLKDVFVSTFKQVINEFYGNNIQESSDYARIIHKKHFDKLKAYLSDGVVAIGGGFDEESRYIEPTVLVDVDTNSPVMQEEIFGPILPIITYQKEEEVIPFIRRYDKPLALYHFTKNSTFKKAILKQVSFGGGCVNDTLEHLINPHLPFGGVGSSGLGEYHGKYGFDALSHFKSVLEKPAFFDLPLKYPPYGRKLQFIRKLFKIS